MKTKILPVLAFVVIGAARLNAATFEAPLDARRQAKTSFAAPPEVAKAGEGRKITFVLSELSDVEVAVLDGTGQVVRHLAAGLLGSNAPAPFKKNSAAQELYWDGKDDLGKQIQDRKGLRVRVRAGSAARLEKIAGWNGNSLGGGTVGLSGGGIVGLAVGAKRELFVILSDTYWGRSEIRVFSPEGSYLRTIMPYPSSTPVERTAPVGQIEVEGTRMPVVFNAHGQNLSPLVNGMKLQNMVWHPDGYLLMASAVGSMSEQCPMRHLLAVHPEGGAPVGLGFVGPLLQQPRKFMDGMGEAGANFFDHLALSPDGRTIYVTLGGESTGFPKQHYIRRVKWTDKEAGAPFIGRIEPGSDDEHLSDPQGVATDAAGNIYVCDRGNNRLQVFSSEGRFLGKLAVDNPEQIFIHRKTGAFYILSRPKPFKWEDKTTMSGEQYKAYKARIAENSMKPKIPTTLRKFAPWAEGKTDPLLKLEIDATVLALDQESELPRLWAAVGLDLVPIDEKDGGFVPGRAVNNREGLNYPLSIAADPAGNRVMVHDLSVAAKDKSILSLDLESGKITPFVQGTDAAFDRKGNLYVTGPWDSNAIFKYDRDGKPLNYEGTNSNRMPTGFWTAYGPEAGLRGHCVGLNGDIYMIRTLNHWGEGERGTHSRVDLFGPDGVKKRPGLIDGLSDGDSGIGVDAAGNVYVGSNVKLPGKPLPEGVKGKIPEAGWLWWDDNQRKDPWRYAYYNPYLFHWGSVFKFGAAGGAFYGHGVDPVRAAAKPGNYTPFVFATNAPADSALYVTSYSNREVRVTGALWRYAGVGAIPTTMAVTGWGDAACGCINSRLAVDGFGRVYAPDVFRFSVQMLDTEGNRIARIGSYGNADERGPDIAFAWPAFVSVANGKCYVGDLANRRVSVIAFDWSATVESSVP